MNVRVQKFWRNKYMRRVSRWVLSASSNECSACGEPPYWNCGPFIYGLFLFAMFDVYVYAEALSAAEDHFRQASWEKKEALGLLLGRAFSFEGRAYAVAEEYVTADNEATAVSVKFSREAFSKLSEKLSNGKQVVGWIHSHPDLGCFLSHIDVATHEAFFSEPYHFAFVVDPVRGEKLCFKVKHSRSVPVSFAIIRNK